MLPRAKVLLIDGSNAVHAIFGPLPAAREEQNLNAADFIEDLSQWAESRPELEIEVVFDGGPRQLKNPAARQCVRILFSDHGSADAVILERIRALRYFQKQVIVVTWDKDLAEDAREEEAKVIDPERLWDAIQRGSHLGGR